MTNATRLQDFDHKLNQSSRQRDAQNVSDALTHLLQHAACPAAGQTPGLVPLNSDQGQQAMLAAFANQVQLQAEAKVQMAKRKRLRSEQQARTAAQEATARLQQSASAGRHRGNSCCSQDLQPRRSQYTCFMWGLQTAQNWASQEWLPNTAHEVKEA